VPPLWGAAIAYYTVFSLAPMLVMVIAIAGLAFGQKAAEGALFDELADLVGHP
jgi:membrane protein